MVDNWYPRLLSAAGAGENEGRIGLLQRWLGWLARDRSGQRSGRRRLRQTIADLNSRQRDMAFLGELGQLFQACRTVDELCAVAKDGLESISPNLSGALYLMGETSEYFENVMTWGGVDASSAFFAPGDCWALRCGRPHKVSKGHDAIACAHTDAGAGDWHLCMPLMAQGEALGILYFRVEGTSGGRRRPNPLTAADRMQFYLNVSETLSLAVANMRLRESLQHQAIRDPLTGLFNRRYFQETLRRELQRAARGKQPVGVVVLDVDHFKRFNDTFGHDAGDVALKAVGEILLNRSRGGDVACRHGGEEFALALPGLSAEFAAARVEELRREIEMRQIQCLGRIVDPVTISAGIAVYPDHAMDMDSLMRMADMALYESKRAGRNQATMACPQPRETAPPPPLSLVHSLPQAAGEQRRPASGQEWRAASPAP